MTHEEACQILRQEDALLQALRNELLLQHPGKWIVFRHGCVQSIHDTHLEAYEAGLKQFGLDDAYLVCELVQEAPHWSSWQARGFSQGVPEAQAASRGELLDQINNLSDALVAAEARIEALERRRYYVIIKGGPKGFQTVQVQGWDGEDNPPFPAQDDEQMRSL